MIGKTEVNEYGWPKCPPKCEGCTVISCYGPRMEQAPKVPNFEDAEIDGE